MKVYDCDNEEQFEKLTTLTNKVDYIKLNLIQSFSPDNIDEAKNRGFKPFFSFDLKKSFIDCIFSFMFLL